MITISEVLIIHSELIKRFGGADGIRDSHGLESAIYRPFQTFAGEDLYPTAYEKSAAIGESIIMNHPFIDGNKRTGYVLMETLLRIEGLKISASDQTTYEFVIKISTGEIRFNDIVHWLKSNTQPIKKGA